MNVENVSTKVMISTSNHELAYRNKHYLDIRVVEKKQMTCASCGTQLNLESKKIFSHPILGTLQCEKCKICFENEDLVTDSDCINQYCYLCGRQCNSLYICSSAKCPYGFCKKCIKRNVRECLQDAESEDWKCFVCNIKPFWKLRAICAAVTTALVKKPRRNKFSQCDNNDREDGSSESENSDNEVIFKKTNRGSVYRKQLAHTKKIVKAGKEDPSGSKLSSISTKNEFNRQEKLNKKKRDVEKLNENPEVDDNKKKSLQRLNVTKNQKRNFIQDSDLTEKDEAIQDSRKITRLKKSETYGKHKSLRSVHIQTDDDECYERRNANNKKEKKQRVNVSETEMVERNYVSARTSRGESKNSRYENQDSDVEENEYHQEDKVPKSKRLITSSKDRSMRAKRDPYSKQSEKKEIQCSNNKHGKEQKSLLLRESESEKEYSEEDKSKHSRKSEVLFKKRIKEDSRSYNYGSEEEETKIDMKISKQMLEKTRKNDTESSSGKEFQKSTLFERRHRPMRKLYTIDEGNAQGNKKRLITSQIELTDKKKLMTRKQRLTLKAYMKRLLNELKVLCSKFTSDTEKLNQKYCTKELIRVDDAVQMVLRSKDLVCGYKVKLDELETEFVKSCNTWCRECDMKNIFAKPNCVSVYDSMHSPVKRMSYDKWKMKEELEDEEGGDEGGANVNINKRNGLARCSTPVENTSILSTDELKNDSDRCESRLSRKSNSIVQKESCDSSDSSQSLKNIETETSSVKNRCERLSEGDRSTSCSTEIFTAGSKHNKSRCSDIENKSSNENAVEVSECDSEEIFSESEAQMSRLRSIARKKKEQMHSTTEQLRDKSEITVDSADNSDRGKILKKVKRLRKRIVQRLDDSDASSTNSDGKSVEPTAVDQLEGEEDTNFKKKLKVNMINKEGNGNKEESMENVCKKGNGKEETSLYSDLKLANDDFILNGNNQNDTSLNDLFDSSVDKDKDEGTKSSTLIQTEDTQFKEGDSTMRSNAESKDNTKTYEKENRSKTENILETNQDNSDSSSNDSNLKSSKRDIGQTRKGKVSQFENELSEKKRRDSKHDSMSSDEEDVDTVLTQNLRKKPRVKRGYVGVDQDISDIVTSTEEEALKLQDSENDKRCANELLYSDTDSENSKEPDKGKKCGNDEKCSTKVLSVASSQISNDKSELKSRSSDVSSKCSFEENLKTLDSDVDSTCSTVVILDLHKEKQGSVDKRKSGDVKEKNKRDSKGGSSDNDEKDSLEEKLSEKQETTVAKQLGRGILDSSSNESDCEKMSVKEKHRRRNEDLDEVNLNLRAKEALLGSSSSLSDVSDQSFKSESSFKSSDSDLHFTRSSRKRHCDIVSDTSTSSKLKRKRFKPDKNLYSKVVDKKLKMVCKVLVKRLEQKDLDQHLHILRKSKQHQERKAFKSLLDLDNLEKRHRKNVSNSDDDSSSKSLRESKKKKKNTAEKEKEDTLMDHLEKVENGEIIERSDDESDDSNIDMEKILKPCSTAKEDLMSEANKIAKNLLLNSSSDLDDGEEDEEEESNNDNDKVVNRTKDKSNDKEESVKEEVIELDENCSEDEEESQKRKDKSQWRRDKVLTAKLTESDSDLEEIKWNKSRKNHEKEDERSNSSSNDNAVTVKRRERRVRRKVLQSDSDSRKLTDVNDDSDSAGSIFEKKSSKYPKSKESEDTDDNWTRRAKRAARTSSSDSSVEKIRVKPKRRRIKVVTNDSDSDSDDITSSQGGPGNSSRKNIRKVLKDKQVADNTKQAAKEEEERLKRIAERQKLYNEMYELRLAGEERVNKLVLDFDEETKEELVSVHKDLVKRLKPHQAQGIKFMWDACFESVKRVTSSKGSGCIIAHCMGLGKTLQVVTLAYTLLTHEETGIKTIMVVCPLSTILNWVHEFKMWLKDIDDENEINIFELTKMKKNFERKYQLEEWQRCGGVLMIGYEMFRNLTTRSTKVRKGVQEAILKCLIDPGADLVVCDEGHLLKNEDTALSKAMKRIKTLRRVVLTGTPLQNNLIEYHCMVQFVKPNLLGTKKEFMNRFVNPITNGQFDDSTELDVKLMKKRAHVLHKMLEGSIQRFDYGVLTPFLPPKQEYVIFVKLTECQTKLYRYYLEHLARRSRSQGGSLFADFQQLQRIWTHPFVLKLNAERVERMNEKKRLDESDTEGSLKDFIDDSSDDSSVKSSSSSSNGSGSKDNAQKHVTAANPNDELEPTKQDNVEEEDWWVQFIQQENIEDLRLSAKLVLLFGILKECEQIGDKALVFSQSLYSLTLIEKFLDQVDNETQNDCESELVDGHTGSWSIGLDYFRLDGQTSAENRSHWCRIFNNPSNTRARLFLISTKAGGLGINLTAANRVIIFDASWNPSHDVQSIFRVYRFGQKKPCYIYRFLASGTMEEKIYNRQVTKLSLSCRVVDEQQIERHYSNNDLTELYRFEPPEDDVTRTLNLPKDRLLAEIFLKHKNIVQSYHEHDSLLENKAEEELDEEERKQAWLEYEEEKKGRPQVYYPPMTTNYQHNLFMQQCNMMLAQQQNAMAQNVSPMHIDYENLQHLISKDFPNQTEEQRKILTSRIVMQMYNYAEKQIMNQAPRNLMPNLNAPYSMMNNPSTAGLNSANTQQYMQQQPQLHRLLQHKQLNTRGSVTNPAVMANPVINNMRVTDDEVMEILPTSAATSSKTNRQTSVSNSNNKGHEE